MAQRLLLDLRFEPLMDFSAMDDSIENTVDYDVLTKGIRSFWESREWQLIETLASQTVRLLMENHPIRKAWVRVRKFILPETEFVAAVAEMERLENSDNSESE